MSVWEVDCQEMMEVGLWWYACIFLVPLSLPIQSFLPLPSLLSSLFHLSFSPFSLFPFSLLPLSLSPFVVSLAGMMKRTFSPQLRGVPLYVTHKPHYGYTWWSCYYEVMWYSFTVATISHDVTWCHCDCVQIVGSHPCFVCRCGSGYRKPNMGMRMTRLGCSVWSRMAPSPTPSHFMMCVCVWVCVHVRAYVCVCGKESRGSRLQQNMTSLRHWLEISNINVWIALISTLKFVTAYHTKI